MIRRDRDRVDVVGRFGEPSLLDIEMEGNQFGPGRRAVADVLGNPDGDVMV